jgi:16S rRNA (uracil1498-N3)-methyltransferase
MSPTRLYSPVPLQPHSQLTLDGSQARYVSRALRLRPGDTLTLFDGSGGEYDAKITRIEKSSVDVETGTFLDRSGESNLAIRLVQGISKGDRMDTVVQKATELGVQRISPVLSEYSVVRLDDEKAAKRRDHWQKIAQSACEQCGRNVVPSIDEVISISAWFEKSHSAFSTQLVLTPNAPTTLSSVSHSEAELTLLIGPEGGFSNTEQERAISTGFEPVSLGPRILRTETAAIAAIATVQTLWGDFA